MKLVEVVILVGTQCLSPMQSGAGLTEVAKVPCAVLVRQDPQTSDVEIVPQAAATDPDVIAVLVRPRGPDALSSSADDMPASRPPRPVPRIVATADEQADPPQVATPSPRPQLKKQAPVRAKRVTLSRRTACGSYKAVWYTSKRGHRKYRCVKVS